ncbi:MAG: response regulator [Paracoccaceae bacterium]
MAQKVLIVDDDAETRMIVSDYLSRLSVDHTLVASAGECLAKLVNDPAEYSMVLMDIHMPALSGVDASTWIKDSEIDPPRNIPIIALTADETYHDEDYIARYGMRGVLAKPVTIDALEDTLNRYGSLNITTSSTTIKPGTPANT